MDSSTIEKIQDIKNISFFKTEFNFKSYMNQINLLKENDFIDNKTYKIFWSYRNSIIFNCYVDGEQNGIGFAHPDSSAFFDYYMIMVNEKDHPTLYKLWKSTEKHNPNYNENGFYFVCYFVCKETKKKFLFCKCAEKWLFSEKYKNLIKNDEEKMINYSACKFVNYEGHYEHKKKWAKRQAKLK